MNLDWPLVSRDEELRTISEVLANGPVEAGAPRGVIIVGASGAGRTRLLRTVTQQQRAAGRRVVSVATTTASAAVPFGAVAHLLPPGVGVGQPRVYELAAAAMSVHQPSSGPVIAVDDAHLLDDASAGLLHFLATHGRCRLLLTALMGAALPDTLVALWKDGLVLRRQLDPLPVEAVDDLLAHTLDGPLLSPARAYLHRQCGGYPLDLRELLLAGRLLGVLRRHGTAWNWSGRAGTAPRLVEVVEARMRAFGPEVRSTVDLVACGEPLPITAVEGCAGLPAAEEAGVIQVVTDGRRTQVRLTHPLDAEVLRDTMARARARRAYRTLVTWLAATPMRRTDDHVRLATWQLAAGLPVPTRQLRTAIRAAMASHDLANAQRLARAGARSGDVAGALLLADVDYWLGAHPAGADSAVPPDLHAAARTDPVPDAGRTDPRWTALRARTLYWPLGRAAEAEQLLRVGPLTRATPTMTATRAMMLLFDSQLESAIDTADGLIRRPDAPAEAVLWAYVATVAGNAMRGRTLLALDLAADGLRLADRSNRGGPATAYLRLAYGDALRLAGRLAQAWPHARQGYQQALTTGDPGLVAAWAAHLGAVAQARGRVNQAVTATRDAVLLTESADPHGLRQVYRVAFAGSLALAGDPVEAVRVLHRVARGERPAFRRYAAAVEIVEAGVSAAGGHWRDATSMALRAAARASELGQPILQAEALYDAVRYTVVRESSGRPAAGVRTGVPRHQVRDQAGLHRSILGRLASQLATVAGTTDSVLVAVCADVAAALARDDGPALDALAVAFDQLDTPLFAAETAAAASDAYRDAGQPSAAGEAAERARRLVEKCPQPAGLALAQSDAVGSLTRREREMAVLAAQLTSREIARQLSLSVRTVDNHLARVYAKLGIATRAELPVVLGQRSAEPLHQARARHRYRADPAFGREQGRPGAALRRSSAG